MEALEYKELHSACTILGHAFCRFPGTTLDRYQKSENAKTQGRAHGNTSLLSVLNLLAF